MTLQPGGPQVLVLELVIFQVPASVTLTKSDLLGPGFCFFDSFILMVFPSLYLHAHSSKNVCNITICQILHQALDYRGSETHPLIQPTEKYNKKEKRIVSPNTGKMSTPLNSD